MRERRLRAASKLDEVIEFAGLQFAKVEFQKRHRRLVGRDEAAVISRSCGF
jgi:hypothetical protein